MVQFYPVIFFPVIFFFGIGNTMAKAFYYEKIRINDSISLNGFFLKFINNQELIVQFWYMFFSKARHGN